MTLPQEFQDRMRALLNEEYASFEKSYEEEPQRALCINPSKAGEEFFRLAPFSLEPVPWEKAGYYYGKEDAPGKHPYHEAGVYYIQEPSAMAPAGCLCASPGERVLDLCAAPGGKSVRLASAMRGEGILICNEIHPARAKILSENIERMGVANAIVTNEAPERLSGFFAGYFDKILVDAPCSGEGMFRKNKDAVGEWSLENIGLCAKRQDEILTHAAHMLRPGGRMVYSTCTFAPEENEGSVERFLKKFPEFEIISVEKTAGMAEGSLKGTVRLFPHKLRGEGHFFAVLEKSGSGSASRIPTEKGLPEKSLAAWPDFCKENLLWNPKGVYTLFKENLCLLPEHAPSLRGIKVLRAGLHLGFQKKNRFEPSHALALFLNPKMVRRRLDLSADGDEIRAYLGGGTIGAQGDKGWHLITADGYSTGWGKLSGGVMKNHYPKGLRKIHLG